MLRINNPVIHIIKNHVITYPTPFNLSYLWGFGSLAGLCLVIQIVSGLILAMHYTANIDSAFLAVEHIMRDVNFGWFFRYLHANGASMFFIIVYLHIGRGLFYRSYIKPRDHIWYSGLGIFVLLMATAFLGYVLPWGQMSYWGATVITNLFSAIPIVGQKIAYLLWGGYSVDNATLTRFFVLHFVLPFGIAGLALLHIMFLHIEGSNNPLGVPLNDYIPFFPYFVIKDLFGFWIFMGVFVYLICYNPNLLGHPDNYIPANPLVTPAHIVPEWYFLPFYAILRAIPDKLGGVLLMGAAIAVFFLLPTIDRKALFLSPIFRPIFNILFWFFISSFFLLMWLGAEPVEEPFTTLSANVAIFYFGYFALLPLLNELEFEIFARD